MAVTDQQVRLLMETYTRTNSVETASAKADMCRQTGAKYLGSNKLPSENKVTRSWRTREDPLAQVWDRALVMLDAAPELEAKALFEFLCVEFPDVLQENMLRTFQRRVNQWRAMSGPDREVFFAQDVKPGRRMSLDFTHMNTLNITIGGMPFNHMVCHCALSYSNWEWATVCFSESLLALRAGIQAALFRLGHVPKELWTDNSTAATHNPAADDGEKRPFNAEYLEVVGHFGLEPHTINIGQSNENGTIESDNGHLKRRLEQQLLLRGSRDFVSREAYVEFLNYTLEQANRLRHARLEEELKVMPLLSASKLAEWNEERATVRKWSVAHIGGNIYSVPSRLIGEEIVARLYEDRIEIYYKNVLQLTTPRLRGRSQARIDYHHIIHSLVRKPGAFQDYRYREELFPTLNFRRTYDRLRDVCSERTADLEYLRILKLSADTSESTVDTVLSQLLEKGTIPRWSTVEEFIPITRPDAVPHVSIDKPDLNEYPQLNLEELS